MMTSDRWARIERELATGPDGGHDLGKTMALVYSALTELMTDGLLRPGEGVKKNGVIPHPSTGCQFRSERAGTSQVSDSDDHPDQAEGGGMLRTLRKSRSASRRIEEAC